MLADDAAKGAAEGTKTDDSTATGSLPTDAAAEPAGPAQAAAESEVSELESVDAEIGELQPAQADAEVSRPEQEGTDTPEPTEASDAAPSASVAADSAASQEPESQPTGSSAPCIACGADVPSDQAFCTKCGATQSPVSGTAPSPAPAASTVPAQPVPAVTESKDGAARARELVGQQVVFITLSRRDRIVRTHPQEDAEVLPNYFLGKCRVVNSSGAWVQLQHSSGASGWAPVSAVRRHRAVGDQAPTAPVASAPVIAPPPVPSAPAAPVSSTPAQPVAPVAATPTGGEAALPMIEALERLHLLHASGALTDDEFSQAKQALFKDGAV